jgi:hypothetical protein
MDEIERPIEADGLAALGICESLLLALTDLKIMTEASARDLLTDVVNTHRDAASRSKTPGRSEEVVKIVERILAGKDGVRPA